MPERSADWMAQAKRDLSASASLGANGYYEWACFVAEQAAEKALKAVFQSMHGEVRGHNLSEMLPYLGVVPREIDRAARRLEKLYLNSRYPDNLPSGSPQDYFFQEDAEQAMADAGTIIEWCDGQIPRRQ